MSIEEINGVDNNYRQVTLSDQDIVYENQNQRQNNVNSTNLSGDSDDQKMSNEEMHRRMERLQDTLKNHNVEISYNDKINRYAIKILDADSKEVVKEIPSEKTLDMFARMLEIEGLLVDEKR